MNEQDERGQDVADQEELAGPGTFEIEHADPDDELAGGEEEVEYIDGDEIFEQLALIRQLLESQAKEIAGMRRELREVTRGSGPRREREFSDRDRERPFRPQGDRPFRPQERPFRPAGDRERGGGRERAERPRSSWSDRPERETRPRSDGFQNFRPARDDFRGRREGRSGDDTRDRPTSSDEQGRPTRPRKDHGWGRGR